jgi:Fe-S cluster assembly protein SufD
VTGTVETGRSLEHVLANGKVFDNGPAWLRQLREQASQRFAAVGYPTTRTEEWKYTNVASIVKTQFRTGEYRLDDSLIPAIEKLKAGVEAISLVFVNGKHCRQFSTHETLPGGLIVRGLAEALESDGDRIRRHLARESDEMPAFVAFNTASFEDGAFVEVPAGLVLDRPVHLIFISASTGIPSICHPRNLIIVGDLAQASIIETYAGSEGDVYFTNSVTDLIAGAGSVVHHSKLQKESSRAFHIASLRFNQSRQSSLTCHSFSFGGALSRNDIGSVLEEGAEGVLNGLYVVSGKQHVDHHTVIDHARPHAASRELYKGVLDGHAGAVFNGKVIVRKDAQKTDAKQTNRNLLLSEEASINTKPELQIYADDVRCTHGATIGQLEENSLFYLRSRGIGEREARHILIHAFAHEIIGQIKPDDFREQLERELDTKLRDIRGEVS